jgi:hypothetical protein
MAATYAPAADAARQLPLPDRAEHGRRAWLDGVRSFRPANTSTLYYFLYRHPKQHAVATRNPQPEGD